MLKNGKMPNTSMKLGGMAMRYLGLDFHLNPEPPSSDTLVAAWQPYFDTCVEAFGPDRCMSALIFLFMTRFQFHFKCQFCHTCYFSKN